jgi:hypothetical protein
VTDPRRGGAPLQRYRFGITEEGPIIDVTDFEGSLVLEQLAAIGDVEAFFDAIEADEIKRTVHSMKRAHLDASTIATLVRKVEESDGSH